MREVNKIDYAGFMFAGIHSSQFGLYSVSSGDRYSKYLSPTLRSLTAENTGGNGTYYFGTQYVQQPFNFSMAFDSVTEQEIREIKKWLSSDVSPLILDELPYVQYYVRVASAPQFSFLAFSEEGETDNLPITDLYAVDQTKKQGARLYKGELSISFIAYEPFGYVVDKWLDNYSLNATDARLLVLNKEEWAESSGLLSNNKKDGLAYFDTYNNGVIPLYNCGDMETDFILKFTIDGAAHSIQLLVDGYETSKMMNLTIAANDITPQRIITIDTKKRLITCTIVNGVNKKVTVINDCLSQGDFFTIPITDKNGVKLQLVDGLTDVSISYPYKFF